MPTINSPSPPTTGVKREAEMFDEDNSEFAKDNHTPKKRLKAGSNSTSPTKSSNKGPGKSPTKTRAAPRPWTGAEFETLLRIALSKGASRASFENAIPGRTGFQCIQTWRNTLHPYLLNCARAKGDAKGKNVE